MNSLLDRSDIRYLPAQVKGVGIGAVVFSRRDQAVSRECEKSNGLVSCNGGQHVYSRLLATFDSS